MNLGNLLYQGGRGLQSAFSPAPMPSSTADEDLAAILNMANVASDPTMGIQAGMTAINPAIQASQTAVGTGGQALATGAATGAATAGGAAAGGAAGLGASSLLGPAAMVGGQLIQGLFQQAAAADEARRKAQLEGAKIMHQGAERGAAEAFQGTQQGLSTLLGGFQ